MSYTTQNLSVWHNDPFYIKADIADKTRLSAHKNAVLRFNEDTKLQSMSCNKTASCDDYAG